VVFEIFLTFPIFIIYQPFKLNFYAAIAFVSSGSYNNEAIYGTEKSPYSVTVVCRFPDSAMQLGRYK